MKSIIKQQISEKKITLLNEILTNKNLKASDIKSCFSIAIYIIKVFGNNSDQILNQFNDFCQNIQINKKECFSELLQKINSFLYHYSHLPKEEQTEIQNQNNIWAKFTRIISIATNNTDLDDKEYINLLTEIINSNLDYENYYYIDELFKNEIMKENHEKRKLAFDIILNKKVTRKSVNDKLNQSRWNVLTSEDILALDDESYKKVVEISTSDIQIYALDIAFQQDNLTPNKKKAIIDYYYYILKLCFITNQYYFHKEYLERDIKNNKLLNVVYCNRLIAMDDETYKETLENIKKSNKPTSYINVLRSDNITEEQLEFALNMINTGEVRKHKGQRDDIITNDYKESVSDVAISPVLTSYPIDEYKNILTIINDICEHADKVSYNHPFSDKSNLLFEIKLSVSRLFNNTFLFSQNMPRLLMAIEAITSTKTRSMTHRIYNFCNNENSAYYTNEQYQKILELIKKEEPVNLELLLGQLFTNKNVPFMKDRNELLELAACNDRNHIKRFINIYNSEGLYNMNLYRIFNNVESETIKEITGGINIKKLIQPQKTKTKN